MEQSTSIQEHFQNPILKGFFISIGIIIGLYLLGIIIWDAKTSVLLGGKRKR